MITPEEQKILIDKYKKQYTGVSEPFLKFHMWLGIVLGTIIGNTVSILMSTLPYVISIIVILIIIFLIAFMPYMMLSP